MARPRKMHQTTIRFGADTWVAVDQAAELIGVSVAQYVRDATLARLAAERAPMPQPVDDIERAVTRSREPEIVQSESRALWAQARRARGRAEQLRQDAARARASSRGGGG